MPYTDYTVRLGDLKRAILKNPYDPNLNIDGYMRYLKYNTPSAQPEQRWIPCNEQLPEGYQKAILCNRHGEMMIGTWTEFGWMTPCYFDKAVAWMPLPEPYEGEKEES